MSALTRQQWLASLEELCEKHGGRMNDHIPDEIAKCKGKYLEDPHWGALYKQQCMNCVRRMHEMQSRDKQIMPWFGHGSCPDRLEMQK